MIRRLLGLDLLERSLEVNEGWQRVIEEMQAGWNTQALEYERAIHVVALHHVRNHRAMIESFLMALDHPEKEDEIRAGLIAALSDMADEVARLEEQVA